VNTCDDCGKDYPGEPYYTFEAESCNTVDIIDGAEVAVDHDCTENICPECAGPFLEPDIYLDPRRPPVDFYDEKMHQSMFDQAQYEKHGDQTPVAYSRLSLGAHDRDRHHPRRRGTVVKH